MSTTPTSKSLAKTTEMLRSGKVKSMAEVFESLAKSEQEPEGGEQTRTVVAFVVPQISEEQQQALSRVTEVFGSVVPTESRALTAEEKVAIEEERTVIDKVLKFLAERKDTSIRETLAHHMDSLARSRAEEAGDDPDDLPLDAKGHVAVKDEDVVYGTRKIARTVSQGKPSLSLAAVERAYADGDLDKATYMSITRQTRVLDEDKVVAEMKKNPALAHTLFGLTTVPLPSTSITIKG